MWQNSRLTNLSKLSLTASRISDESLRHVAGMKRLTQLTVGGGRRDASAPQLNIEGVLQFTNLPHLYRLEVQSMEAPSGCLGLRALKQLRLLTMDGSFSTKEEEKLLAALMPEAAVNVTRMEGYVVFLTGRRRRVYRMFRSS